VLLSSRNKQTKAKRRARFGLYWLEWFGIVMLSAFCFAAQFGYRYLNDPKHFAIQSVDIKGNWHHVGKERIQEASLPLLQAGFFGLNVNALQIHLQALPWVESVSITRVWPSKVIIYLTEHTAVARFNDHELLAANGELFAPPASSFPKNLVHLKGSREKVALLWRTYEGMQKMLDPLSQHITEVELANRGAWKIILDEHTTVLLGREDLFLRLAHYVKAAPLLLQNREKQAKRLDLRYPNGMSVVWQSAQTQIQG